MSRRRATAGAGRRRRCAGCGECCGHHLPMTGAEIRLYCAANTIEPRAHPTDCPWLAANRTCAIYRVRPSICRAFHRDRKLAESMPGRPEDYHTYNTARLFIGGDERTYDGLREFAGALGGDSYLALFGGGDSPRLGGATGA